MRTDLPSPALDADVVAALRAQVPAVAELTVTCVAAEVPQYAGALHGEYRRLLEDGVRLAYDGFLGLLVDGDPDGAVLARARRGAYALGRGEARARRSIDALLAAYRVGARVHWQELSRTVVEQAVGVRDVADLAALLLAYNHELSAAGVAGHEAETAARGRLRERRLERLARALIAGEPTDVLFHRAEEAGWTQPQTLTVVLLPDAQAGTVAAAYPEALTLSTDTDAGTGETVVLIPDAHEARRTLLRALAGESAVVGPARPWTQAGVSYRRAVRGLTLPRPPHAAPLDTDRHLAELLLAADPDTLADLRAQALAPLAGLPADTVDRLADTLRSWLLHQGRRDAVAAELHVHPQTVRYRMTQIRERYGDALTDPQQVLSLILALAHPA